MERNLPWMRTVKRSFVNRSFFSSRCKGRLIFCWWNYSDKNWFCKMNNYSGGEWQIWQFLRVKNKRPRLITMGWMKKKKEKRRRKKRKREKTITEPSKMTGGKIGRFMSKTSSLSALQRRTIRNNTVEDAASPSRDTPGRIRACTWH